jgi:class 3 adenylate cyclase
MVLASPMLLPRKRDPSCTPCRFFRTDILSSQHRDAFFVAFARATDAVSAAMAAQHALAAHPWPDGVSVRVRMGLHTGEPQLSAEGYVGLDVHRAARIMSAGAAL